MKKAFLCLLRMRVWLFIATTAFYPPEPGPGIDKARSVALLLAFVAAGLSGEFFHRGADALNSEECSWQIRK